jgi:hypothetical protein
MLQIRREDTTGMLWKIVSEKEDLERFVKTHNYDALCLTEWLAPIRNDVIVNLLSKTKKEIDNNFISGVIVCGQFALDEDVRKVYVDILTEQGYEVELYPVVSSWGSLLTDCLIYRTSIKRALKNWVLFTKQFSRQYAPPDTAQTKAVVVSPEIATRKDIPGTFELVVMLEALQAQGYAILVIDLSKDTEGIKKAFETIGFPKVQVIEPRHSDAKISLSVKQDVFWTAIANYYDVKLVIEHDAVSIPKWRDIGLPVISLTNIFDVEYLI